MDAALTRHHQRRLREVYRSAGWPCHDNLELDLLGDLRRPAKRAGYQWLSCETHCVIAAGIATPDEVPLECGVWAVHGLAPEAGVQDLRVELLRPALHRPMAEDGRLPFGVWMALARATPVLAPLDEAQPLLDSTDAPAGPG